MKKYGNYPIYINYNIFTKEELSSALLARTIKFYASRRALSYIAEQNAWRKKNNREPFDYEAYMREYIVDKDWEKRRDEIAWEKQTPESRAYEDAVVRWLDKIVKTPPGKILLDSMVPTEKVWIVFHDKEMGVAATTPFPMSDEMGGGIRLYFDPSGFDPNMEYYTPDDVLFHELIHAYRAGRRKHIGRKLAEYETAEEFLAIHIQNVYMAYMGRRKYYFSHSHSSLATKDAIYDAIKNENENLFTLRQYLQEEPYAQAIAKLTDPDFNCWRDLGNLDVIL